MNIKLLKQGALGLTIAFAASASLASSGSSWSYEGATGPEHWGDLSPAYHMCKDGQVQSPIDIGSAEDDDLPAIIYNYHDTPLAVLNNGHTIEVEYHHGSSISFGSNDDDEDSSSGSFDLLQFHFHTPSENTKGGAPFDMEAHLVHINSSGQLAVVGVFMKVGNHNPFFQQVLDAAPHHEGTNHVAGVEINVDDFLPEAGNRKYWGFDGSLTTPPCSEGVLWHVLQKEVEISSAQLAEFQGFFAHNARPVQPLNGRVINESQ